MRKIRLSELLLLSLAGLLDFIADVKDPLDFYSSYYNNFYGYIPDRWKKQNFYKLVKNQLDNRTIKKIKKGKKIYLKISNKGLSKISQKFYIYSLREDSWDGVWRIIIFDIQEMRKTLRNSFRRGLKNLGFGQLQKSVWISPYSVFENINKFIDKNELSNNVIIFETTKLSLSNQDIVKTAWNLNSIKKSYITSFKKLSYLKNNLEINRNIKKDFKRIHKKLLDVLLNDPNLPIQLLPKDWPKDKTLLLSKELKIYIDKNQKI